MRKACHFEQLPQSTVRCRLCPHHCVLTDQKRGICLTRQNLGGTLYSLNYNRPVAEAIDPIEKKPLYHFHPGSFIYSTGPNGCTFKCSFCQNADISQKILSVPEVTTDELLESVVRSGTIGVAYTYSEPYIWFETIMDLAPRVRDAGLVNIMVTNGFFEPSPLAELVDWIDGMNIDIKSMRPEFYRKLCKAQLEPVLRSCEAVKKRCHLEITNLIIPGENDSDDDFRLLAEFIAGNLGADTPLHLSRYFPRYHLNTPSTSPATLMRAYEITREKLQHVYVGNIRLTGISNDTLCISCGATLVSRSEARTEILSDRTAHGKIVCHQCTALSGILI